MADDPQEPPDITGVFSVLSAGFRLSRKEVALIIRVGWVLTMSTFALWVIGGLGFLGIAAPYARAADVSTNRQSINAITASLTADRVERLENEIFNTRRLQCEAIRVGTAEQKSQYADRLQDKVAKYRQLTNAYPRVPGCDEVSYHYEYSQRTIQSLREA